MIVTEFPKTLQGWFDNAWQWAVVEKHPPAVQSSGIKGVNVCQYRAKNGCRCLIGISIPDSKYIPEMERRPASEALSGFITDTGFLKSLDSLQHCHDMKATSPDYISAVETELRRFATAHHLAIPKPAPDRRRKSK